MKSRLLPILILLLSLFSCSRSSKTDGQATPLIYDFRPARANLNPGSSTLLLANFVGGTATIDQGIGPVLSGVPVPISPDKTTTYTLTVKGESGELATATTTISVGPLSISLAPSAISVVMGQSQAFIPTVIGLADTRLAWSAEGGTIDSNGVFVAGNAPGTYLIGAQSLADPTLCAKAFVTVLPAPLAIAISVNPPATAVTSGQAITLTAQITPSTANGAVTWSATGGTITSAGVFTAPNATGPVTVTATSQIDPTKSASTTFDIIAPPATPVVTAPAFVTAGQAGYTASVPVQVRSSYAWTITGGSIQGSATGNSISFTPDVSGVSILSCIVTNAAGTSSPAGAATSTIVPAPTQPVMTFPGNVTANQAGYTASIPPQVRPLSTATAPAGSTYAWTITGGTIQGSITGTSISFTAGSNGTVQLSCVVTNAAGTPSPAGLAMCNIIPVPDSTVSAPSQVTANTGGYIASVPTQPGSSYNWSITGGTIQGSLSGPSITFTAGSSGTVQPTCIVTNLAGTASTPGSALCSIIAAPVATSLIPSTASPLYGATVTLTPSFSNGTATLGTTGLGSSDLSASATSGTAITTAAITSAHTYTLTVTNGAGTTATTTVTVTPQTIAVAAISPATANVTTGLTQAFTSSVSGALNTTVNWSVDGIAGGNAAVGTISVAGLYTAGTTTGAHTIRATAAADGTTSQTATATVYAAPVATSLVPSTASPLYGATVTLTPSFSNGTATLGTTGLGSSDISASATSGAAITTAAITSAHTYTLTVTNGAGTTATTTVTVTPQTVAVAAISPATANVTAGLTQAFTSSVSGALNTTVNWSVDGIASGNAAVGTITNAGLYTAGTTTGAHTIRATAAADGTTSQTATATVYAAPVISSFTSSQCSTIVGSSVTLTPVFTGGTATIDQGIGTVNSGIGYPTAVFTTPAPVTYTLTVTNALGTVASQTTTVHVQGFLADGSLNTARQYSTTAMLPDGRVLIIGGSNGTSTGLTQTEVYNATTGLFSNNANLANGRARATATLLPNGTVLVSGGISGASVYSTDTLVNPAGTGSLGAAPLATGSPRVGHTATLLPNGQVLLAGGWSNYMFTALTSQEELYIPSNLAAPNNTVITTANMATPRALHAAVLLPNGRVLVVGGVDTNGLSLASTELYDSFTHTWSPGPSLNTARKGATATLLTDGRVLVTGGIPTGGADLSSAEILDAAVTTFTPTPKPMLVARSAHQANLLANGQVLITGGSSPTAVAEVFDPATLSFNSTATQIESRSNAATVLLPNGRALIIGGQNPGFTTSQTSEAFYPGSCSTSVLIQPLAAKWWVGSSVPYVAVVDTPLTNTSVTWSTSAGAAPAGTAVAGTGNGVTWTTPAASGASNLIATSQADGTTGSLQISSGPVTVTATIGGQTYMGINSDQRTRSATVTGALDTTVTWDTTEPYALLSDRFTAHDGVTYTTGNVGGTYTVTATSAADHAATASIPLIVLNPPTIASLKLTQPGGTGTNWQVDWTYTVDPNSPSYLATLTDAAGTTVANPVTSPGTLGVGLTPSDGYKLVVRDQVFQTAIAYASVPTFTLGVSPATASTTVGDAIGLSLSTVENGLAAGPYGANWTITEANGGSLGTFTGTSTAYFPPGLAGTYHVVATSTLDPSKQATATIQVLPFLALLPSTRTTTDGGKIIIGHAMPGAKDPSVTWSLTPPTAGTPATIDANGVITVPPSGAVHGTYTVTATSVAYPSLSATTTVQIILSGAGAPLAYGNATATNVSLPNSTYTPRFGHCATRMADGRVLVTGGSTTQNGFADITQAQIYDPSTGNYTAANGLFNLRRDHTATLMADGKVLLVGGYGWDGNPVSSVEIYDPTTNLFSSMGYLTTPRAKHTAALLPNGRVFVVGGDSGIYGGILSSAEIYDAYTSFYSGIYHGSWTTVAGSAMQNARVRHAMVPLLDGTLLVMGGSLDASDAGLRATVDRFTPSGTDPSTGAWTVEASLQEALGDPAATLLPSGNVLLAGGTTSGGLTNHLEIFDAATKTFSLPASPTLTSARRNAIPLLGADGKVHLLGGWNGTFFTTTHDVFNPATITLGSGVSTLLAPRENGVNGRSVLLLNGSLFTMGYDSVTTSQPGNASEQIQFQ